MLTTTVRTNSTAPRAITELAPSPGSASANWFTIDEPSVAPGPTSECGQDGSLPMTSATAIASPNARPMASVTAAAMPGAGCRPHDFADDLPARGPKRHGCLPVGHRDGAERGA